MPVLGFWIFCSIAKLSYSGSSGGLSAWNRVAEAWKATRERSICSLTVLNDFWKLNVTVGFIGFVTGAGTKPYYITAGTSIVFFFDTKCVILPKKYRLWIVFIMASIDTLFLASKSKSRLLIRKLNSVILEDLESRGAKNGSPWT